MASVSDIVRGTPCVFTNSGYSRTIAREITLSHNSPPSETNNLELSLISGGKNPNITAFKTLGAKGGSSTSSALTTKTTETDLFLQPPSNSARYLPQHEAVSRNAQVRPNNRRV